MKSLEGIKVVAIEHAIAAPFCSRQLADLGARVIKIERPGSGDFARGYDERVSGLSSHFVWVNRGKESVALDLKNPDAIDAVLRLLLDADVFIQNLAPGAAERMGLDFERLHALNPRLIVCGISGYGPDGPYRDKKAYDLLIQSESGFLSVTGTGDMPVKSGCSIADIAAGMYAYTNVLAALFERERTGVGKRIDISMLEAMVEWMGFPMYYTVDDQPPPARAGAAHATIYPYGPFPAGDGKTVMLGLQNEREWTVFCTAVLQLPEVAQDPRFASNPLRLRHQDALRRIIDGVFSTLTAQALTDRLDAAKIANANLNDMHDVWRHPQLAARQRWRTAESPVGPVPVLLPPGVPSSDMSPIGPIPALGAHTESVLAELGLGRHAIDALLGQPTA